MVDVYFRWQDKEYGLDFQTLTGREALLLEQVTELKPAALLADFSQGGARGVLGFLLIALRRADVEVSWDELLNEPVLKLEGRIDGVGETVDPSTASTQQRKGGRRAASGSTARSRKS